MKLRAEIEGQSQTIEIKRDGTRVIAEIEGRRYELDAGTLHATSYLLLHEGRVFDCRVNRPVGKPNSLEVTVNNRKYSIVLTDPRRLRGSGISGAHTDGTAQVVAPMPGKVVRVLVDVGAEVQPGTGIVVVEAMKMQNELKSPKAGKISILNAVAGATVNAGDVLAVVE